MLFFITFNIFPLKVLFFIHAQHTDYRSLYRLLMGIQVTPLRYSKLSLCPLRNYKICATLVCYYFYMWLLLLSSDVVKKYFKCYFTIRIFSVQIVKKYLYSKPTQESLCVGRVERNFVWCQIIRRGVITIQI